MVESPDLSPMNVIWGAGEVIGAERRQPRKHRVNLGLGGDERVQSGVVGFQYSESLAWQVRSTEYNAISLRYSERTRPWRG